MFALLCFTLAVETGQYHPQIKIGRQTKPRVRPKLPLFPAVWERKISPVSLCNSEVCRGAGTTLRKYLNWPLLCWLLFFGDVVCDVGCRRSAFHRISIVKGLWHACRCSG